jgi:quercetin dioxygenase-like cupin family protein
MAEIIDFGSLTVKFLQSREDTGGSVDLFELTLQPGGRMPVPHYHESWDETVYGLTGTSTWRVDGKDVAVGPGETVFIRRGVVHGFDNRSGTAATCLCVLTPGALGPSYFREMANLIQGGAPDPAKMKDVMLRHGLVPVSAG